MADLRADGVAVVAAVGGGLRAVVRADERPVLRAEPDALAEAQPRAVLRAHLCAHDVIIPDARPVARADKRADDAPDARPRAAAHLQADEGADADRRAVLRADVAPQRAAVRGPDDLRAVLRADARAVEIRLRAADEDEGADISVLRAHRGAVARADARAVYRRAVLRPVAGPEREPAALELRADAGALVVDADLKRRFERHGRHR